jgi:hypothetical protein
MRELHTEIEIEASADSVWDILTGFADYPRWNPFIRQITGIPEKGARLEVQIKPPGSKGMTFRPIVTRVAANLELRWLGRLLFPKLFDGEHIFEIESRGGNTVRFIQRENFSGLLVPLLWKSLDSSTRRGFSEMNRALKTLAEATHE